jgi:DNA invertase Pin-like site-specific DNA recombinase
LAIVYVRQSSPGQVQRNPESTARQYEVVSRALDLGWQRHHVLVIDEDQGTSANGIAIRSGFGHLTAEVVLGRVGIVLGLELSRLARSNADWYRLLDLRGSPTRCLPTMTARITLVTSMTAWCWA